MLQGFLEKIDTINDWVGKITRWLIIILLGTVLSGVVSRYIFDKPFLWTHEISKALFGGYFVLGIAYAYLWESHIKVDVFYRNWSPKVRAVVDLGTSSVFFLFCVVLCWQGWALFWHSFTTGAKSWAVWAVPYAFMQAPIPIAGFLLLIQGCTKFIRDLNVFLGRWR